MKKQRDIKYKELEEIFKLKKSLDYQYVLIKKIKQSFRIDYLNVELIYNDHNQY